MKDAASVHVAVVGGGPAGAAAAIGLAAAGREVLVLERQPAPRWRAGGVYSSPRTRALLADLGLDVATRARLIRPIAAMEVRTTTGAHCSLGHAAPWACGVDRVRLERALLDRARDAGAMVEEGAAVRTVEPRPEGGAWLTLSGDPVRRLRARVVVGADGPRSLVARAVGADRPIGWFRRAGITVHQADPDAPAEGVPAVAVLTVGPGWYCGVAPVPGGRVNIGVVVPEGRLRAAVTADPDVRGAPTRVLDEVLAALPAPDGQGSWRSAPRTDAVTVALPLAHRPRRLAGRGWLLVGDAAGFLDPLSGEGLHRALFSARLAAEAIIADDGGRVDALLAYDRRMRRRFDGKDAVSWLLQGFLARPELTAYAVARLASRPRLARTFNAVLTDQAAASRAVDPRFLLRLLAP